MKRAIALAAITASWTLFAAPQVYTVDSVVALTNVLANLPDVSDDTYNNSRIEIAPGVYDLSGVYMNDDSHLYVKHSRGLLITGMGEKPGDTVLLGGGQRDNRRVLHLYGGNNWWWNTVSNLTITGGYTSKGGAGAYSRSVATMYVDCVVSNNVATSESNDWTGGAIKNGCAVRTYFADNSAALAGGAIECGGYITTMSLQPYTADCYFTNNVQTKGSGTFFGGGAVAGGYHTNCTFVGNSAKYGGAGGFSNTGRFPVFVGCRFIANKSTSYGGAIVRPCAVTNCVFISNTGNCGAIFAHLNGWSDETRPFSVYGCHFTNNVSTSYAGAVWANGNIRNSVFHGNESALGGGAFVQHNATLGANVLSGCTFVSNRVHAVQNNSEYYGGAVRITAGGVENCTFIDNLNTNAAAAAMHIRGAKGDVTVSGCTFIGNKGRYDCGILYGPSRQVISNCTFTGEMTGNKGIIANDFDLVDCVVSNVTSDGWLLYDCNLTRCSVISNLVRTINGQLSLDCSSASGSRTNLNCVFYGNEYTDNANHFINAKVLVNCTFAGNRATSAGNYGSQIFNCTAFNTLFFGNTIKGGILCDLRTKLLNQTVPFAMTNCVFTALDLDVTSAGFGNCRLVPASKVKCGWVNGKLKLDLKSCAVDSGMTEPWLIASAGDFDVYGMPRVHGGGIDVGAVECQDDHKGMLLLVK